jgi:hypothetical protein
MKAVGFGAIAPVAWNELCTYSPQAWLFHRAEWIAIETKWSGVENHSFALVEGEQLVGVHPLYFQRGGEQLVHSGIHRETGLALGSNLPEGLRAAARSTAIAQVFAVAEQCDADRIQLNAHNLAPENLSSDRAEIPFWVLDYGFFLGLNFAPQGLSPAPGLTTCSADQIVELDRSEEEMFAALDESCRRAVRKAIQHELQLEVAESHTSIDSYYDLARRSARRTGESLHSIQFYHDIWARCHDLGRCALLFATKHGKAVAALFLLIDKSAMSFLGGVSDPDSLPMRGNDFLHWSAICWGSRQGLRRYRLGPWFPEVPATWPIAQVSRFKTKFGGKSRTIIQGSCFRRPERYRAAADAQFELLCHRSTSGVKGIPA